MQPVGVATPSAPGFLTVNTVPWTKVAVDGELELVNEGAGIADERFVGIESGETLKLNLTLKEPALLFWLGLRQPRARPAHLKADRRSREAGS